MAGPRHLLRFQLLACALSASIGRLGQPQLPPPGTQIVPFSNEEAALELAPFGICCATCSQARRPPRVGAAALGARRRSSCTRLAS